MLGLGSITISVEVNQKVNSRTLTEVLYVPGLGVNLFSIGAATTSGLTAEFKDNKVNTHHHQSVASIHLTLSFSLR